jgi:protein SCO1/2
MNQNSIKRIFLVSILVIPAFVFIFLVLFGDNKFSIPKFGKQQLAILNPKSEFCPPSSTDDTLHHILPFRFISQDGKEITNKDFEGKIYVANFFFTRCPSICPVISSELTRVQEAFQSTGEVKILSHSIDPLYDSIKTLKEYSNHYKADNSMWTFVTGDSTAMYNAAKCGYFIAVQKSENSSLIFDHSDKLILVDKEQRIRGFYSGTKREEVDRLIAEIQILMKENP